MTHVPDGARPGRGIVGIGGGIGAARLWQALATAVDPAELTLVVNTADDLTLHGLRICPDLDTVLYALADRRDRQRGWGLAGDSFRCMEALAQLGAPQWFGLGDLDLATHLLRTGRLSDGAGLAEVTAELARAMGIGCRVLPMSEQPVTTQVRIATGEWLDYQDYYVARAARPAVSGVRWHGIEAAAPAPGVLDAIASARLIVLGPSNPMASMMPVLGLSGVSDAVRSSPARVVAVTPVVSRVPIADPGEARRALSRSALMAAAGLPHAASAVAALYEDVIDAFVLDRADDAELATISPLGVEVITADTLIGTGADPAELLGAVLAEPALR